MAVGMWHRSSRSEELEIVYRENVSAVYAFFAYSVPAHVAEDLTAATFERVIRSWHSFDPARGSVRRWTLSIARNLLTDHFRRQRHRAGPSLDEHPELADSVVRSVDPEARYVGVETIKSWLLQLSPREREVLALRYGADLRTADIAQFLGLTSANVDQISSRALRRLRDRIASPELTGNA
jgi:RNA polymerase sigma factor (sigma-70 family)